jgi:CubicO group peptidase (beta-lactamase class C family)
MPRDLDTLPDYVEQAMASWQIPGVALAVVQGDEVLHLRGYGFRDVEGQKPMTPDTRCAIASMTKAFTSMGVALLVDDGKAAWDEPVRTYLPSFKLSDPYISDHITLRDMLSHRSGLPRHDLAWYNAAFTRQELVHNVRHHAFSKGFRESWQYQNLMYVTAGYLTGVLSGGTWEEFIQKRIFDPLGMADSSFAAAQMQQGDNYSYAYNILRGKNGEADRLEKMPFYDNAVMGPAGSIHASLNDLVKWIKVHVNQGRSGHMQLVTPGNLAQMHRPQMLIPVDGMKAQLLNSTIQCYGMGWFITPYRGYTIIEHGGNIDGFSVQGLFVPQAGLGVVTLTNLNGRPLRDILGFEIVDRVLDLPNGDWNQKYHAIWGEIFKAQDQGEAASDEERIESAPHTQPLEAYTGTFAADGYADFEVKFDDAGQGLLGWLAGSWWPLQHYHYDTFELDMKRFESKMKVPFQADVQGAISALALPLEPAVKDIQFTRKPLVLSAETLKALCGRFNFPFEGMELTIRLNSENRLVGQLTGQSEIELIAQKQQGEAVHFAAKGVPSLSLVFLAEAGAFHTVQVRQAGALYTAPRLA